MTTSPTQTPVRTGADAVTLLTMYLVLLVGLPSRLTLAPLGGVGSPAVIVGLVALALWVYAQVRRPFPSLQGRQPVRSMLGVLLAAVAVSYVVAMSRAIDPDESSTAQLGPVILLSWAGILLVANDGIPDLARFQVFVRRTVLAGGALATLGVVQFVTGETWVDRISIPGLSITQALGGFTSRGGFNRPPGTALHAIEFGAVLTMILPIAVNLALIDRGRNLVRRWYPVAAICLAVVISISRSALICAAVALIMVATAWTPQVRRAALAAFVFSAGAFFTVIPGMWGTITGMFTGIGTDSSAASRVGSYALAGEFISRSPLFGRGYSTFLPKYRILDNQYLGLIIEIGFVGLAAILALLVTGIVVSLRASRLSPTPEGHLMGRSLAAAVAPARWGWRSTTASASRWPAARCSSCSAWQVRTGDWCACRPASRRRRP